MRIWELQVMNSGHIFPPMVWTGSSWVDCSQQSFSILAVLTLECIILLDNCPVFRWVFSGTGVGPHPLDARSTSWSIVTPQNVSCCYCSVGKSCLALSHPMNCSTPGFPAPHYLLEFVQTHVHWAIQPSYPLSPPSPPSLSLSQCQGLFQWVSSSHRVTKVLELQHQPQSFQWIFRVDFL